MKKFLLPFIIFYTFSPLVSWSYNESSQIQNKQNRQFLLKNSAPVLLSQSPSSQSVQYYLKRARNYALKSQWRLALLDYNQVLQINPNVASAYIGRGVVYVKQRKWELALTDFNHAILISPNRADVYINRGGMYSEQKEWELALADFNKAVEINPYAVNAYINRGGVYAEQKNGT